MASDAKKELKPLSVQKLISQQVFGLVRETADAVCPEGRNVFEIEVELLDALVVNCAAKREMTKMLVAPKGGQG